MHESVALLGLVIPLSFAQAQDSPAPAQQQGQQQPQQEPPTTPMSDVLRAKGRAEVLSAAAANQNEQTRRQYIQNQGNAAASQLGIRVLNGEQRVAARSSPL
jgi:hypothetical protein